MTHFVIGYGFLFFYAEDPVFFLFSRDDYFYSFPQICLGYCLTSGFYSRDGCFIYHVCKIGTYSAYSCKSDSIQIDSLIHW